MGHDGAHGDHGRSEDGTGARAGARAQEPTVYSVYHH